MARISSISAAQIVACIALVVRLAPAQTLRVCADPDYLPYSNRAGQGFENRIAEAVAKALGKRLEYNWASYRGHGGFEEFLARTLDSGKCDMVMDIPYGSRTERTTAPYYVSSYVFVFKAAANYDIKSMDSPLLQHVKMGFEADTPPETALKMRGLILHATAFHIGEQPGTSPSVVLEAVSSGRVDIMIVWEPAIGYFLDQYPDLKIVPVPNTRTLGSPEQYSFPMSMGVRESDKQLEQQLNQVIASQKDEFKAILTSCGVKHFAPALGTGGL
jgi:mxaJ protein